MFCTPDSKPHCANFNKNRTSLVNDLSSISAEKIDFRSDSMKKVERDRELISVSDFSLLPPHSGQSDESFCF